MKKISFKILIFISNKKQSKMSNFREIINSLFDSRSSGTIIMSYIETPKEEYKKVYDLVVKEIDTKTQDCIMFHTYKYGCDECFKWSCNINIRIRLDFIFGLKKIQCSSIQRKEFVSEIYDNLSESNKKNLLVGSLCKDYFGYMLDKFISTSKAIHPFILRHLVTKYNESGFNELYTSMLFYIFEIKKTLGLIDIDATLDLPHRNRPKLKINRVNKLLYKLQLIIIFVKK